MKRDYKHKTATFGTDGEWYSASLFQMKRVNQGSLSPDLISVNGDYSPRLAIEVKTGRQNKGVAVKSQLHYIIQSVKDYKEFFKEDPPELPNSLPGLGIMNPHLPRTTVYYDMLNRADSIRSGDINAPFSAIQFTWGDHHIVPGEYGFWAFAAARSMRTGETIGEIADELKQTMRDNIREERSNYRYNKDRQSWQDIHARDMIAIFNNDPELTTKDGKERVKIIAKHYKRVRDLKPITIPGPNETTIYVLALPEDQALFEKQMRRVVGKRREVVERLTNERKRSRGLLKKLPVTDLETTLYANGQIPEEKLEGAITRSQAQKLERLVKWLPKGEIPVDEHVPI